MAQSESRNRANVIISVILIGLGVLILLGQLFHLGTLWPLFIIVPGLLFFVGMASGGKAAGPLAIPGSIVTTVGLILLFQSWTGHFESWTYAWALIVAAVGVGMIIHGKWSADERAVRSGQRVLSVGMIIFLAMGAFFELLFNLSRSGVGSYLWPVVMIAVGIYLLARPRRRQIDAGDTPAPRTVEAGAPPPPPRPKPAPRAEPETAFEPLDMTRGGRGTRSKSKTSNDE